ncbi:type II toxin-antitoxin system PemK/MazF family toxin [Sulfurimonas sp.]|uniref:type II toxin-antitoxin system PemK/MazF family toxin n=1 Tax=Sulfurimonas sp. TaxID=2022749 RepID=UPI0026099C2F|nr:type II toxin-antitoxin system PemK/MazF family toxin [Sulfurimonas sp.]
MSYNRGDIVLIAFPFTDLSRSKKRPVLIIKDENSLGDIVCFQVTSQSTQASIHKINEENLSNGSLKLVSFVKYDKCFTLHSEMVDKKLASVNSDFMDELKILFCKSIF